MIAKKILLASVKIELLVLTSGSMWLFQVLWLFCSVESARHTTHTIICQRNLRPEQKR